MLLTADAVVTPGRTLTPGWLRVTDDRVHEVGEGGPPRPADRVLEGTLVPGFVDIHCHGGGGASFSRGGVSEAERVAATHLRHGTTSLVASLVTDELSALEVAVTVLADRVRDGLLAGIHLEGPWLAPAFAGAQRADLLRVPNQEDVDRLLSAGGGTVRMVSSRGSTSATSRHSSGVDTVASGFPRSEYALAIVWSRAFWL